MTTALTERISRIRDLVHHLGEIITAETTVLRDRRPGELADTRLQKNQLTKAYDEEISELRENPAILAAAQDGEVDTLKSIIGPFRKILDEHNRALFVAKTVTERFIKAVADEVAGHDLTVVGYTKTAQATALTTPPGGRPVSLALNQII
ncbi:MAG: hypothetical protein IID55_00845 [Proteobacteria bacterium]|nr:hypothetical protein [Pseudomonadota bacterium]